MYLLRHGQTEWSQSGRHTGRTDIPLTPQGRSTATDLKTILGAHRFGLVLISPLARARETAALAGLAGETEPLLQEWDYGRYEGLTTAEIRAAQSNPEWTIWSGPIPGGEQIADVAARADQVIARLLPTLATGADCALVAHGHLLRILTAAWLHLPGSTGQYFGLDPGTVSVLGHEHETRVIRIWNAPRPVITASH